jgi:hypothetical protein
MPDLHQPQTRPGRYLRHVFNETHATPAAVRVVGELLELAQLHQRLALLILAVEDPAAMADAISKAGVLLAADCGDCPHLPHPGEPCPALYSDPEGDDQPCGCGAVSLRVVREVLRETAAEALAADARVEYGDDELRDALAEERG